MRFYTSQLQTPGTPRHMVSRPQPVLKRRTVNGKVEILAFEAIAGTGSDSPPKLKSRRAHRSRCVSHAFHADPVRTTSL